MISESKGKHFVLLRNFPPTADWGGTEVVLLDWLARVDYTRCRVTVLVPEGSAKIFVSKLGDKNLPVNFVESDFGRYVRGRKQFQKMAEILKGLKPNGIIFVMGWYEDFNLMHVLAATFVCPGRVYMHENVGPLPRYPVTPKKYFGLIPSLNLWWRKMQFAEYSKAYLTRKVITVSEDVKKIFVRTWAYPSFKVRVSYHGIDTQKYKPSIEVRNRLRANMGVAQEDIIIVATARLFHFKCLDRLINAFDEVASDFPKAKLMLAGIGPLEQELKALAQQKKSAARISFLGFVHNVKELLQMSDIYVLCSDNEGLSLALMEAMSSGLICVSTKCPGSPEAISDGRSGFLVDKSTQGVWDGLKKVLSLSDENRQEMSRLARETAAEKFDVEKNSRRVLAIFGVPYQS